MENALPKKQEQTRQTSSAVNVLKTHGELIAALLSGVLILAGWLLSKTAGYCCIYYALCISLRDRRIC